MTAAAFLGELVLRCERGLRGGGDLDGVEGADMGKGAISLSCAHVRCLPAPGVPLALVAGSTLPRPLPWRAPRRLDIVVLTGVSASAGRLALPLVLSESVLLWAASPVRTRGAGYVTSETSYKGSAPAFRVRCPGPLQYMRTHLHVSKLLVEVVNREHGGIDCRRARSRGRRCSQDTLKGRKLGGLVTPVDASVGLARGRMGRGSELAGQGRLARDDPGLGLLLLLLEDTHVVDLAGGRVDEGQCLENSGGRLDLSRLRGVDGPRRRARRVDRLILGLRRLGRLGLSRGRLAQSELRTNVNGLECLREEER